MSTDTFTHAGLVLGLCGGGLASGLVPVLNAEALLLGAVVAHPGEWVPFAVSLACGQSAAKVLIYLAARDGPERLMRIPKVGRWAGQTRSTAQKRGGRGRRANALAQRASDAALRAIRTPAAGTVVVTASAALGLPPLAVVSALAGVARLPLALFTPACLAGRLLRFALIAWPVAHLVSHRGPGA